MIPLLFLVCLICVKAGTQEDCDKGDKLEYLADFDYDDTLGSELNVIVLVKSFEQKAKNSRAFRTLSGKFPQVIGRLKSRPHDRGVTFVTSLNTTYWDMQLPVKWKMFSKEAYGVDFHDSTMIISCSDHVRVFDTHNNEVFKVRNDWFKHVHHTEISPDGKKILVASSGLDILLEVDIRSGEKVWEWCCWEHGYQKSPLGFYLTRSTDQAEKWKDEGKEKILLVDDPRKFKGIGIPTRKRVCHTNGAMYGGRGEMFVTLGHQGKAVRVNRLTGETTEVLSGYGTPHALQTVNDDTGLRDYVVYNTKRGHVDFLNSDFEIVQSISTETLENVTEGREGLGEWGQWVTQLQGSIFSFVDVHRNMVHIVDVERRVFRSIRYQLDWALQEVARIPTRFEKFLNEHFIRQIPIVTPHEKFDNLHDRELFSLKVSEEEEQLVRAMGNGGLAPVFEFFDEETFDRVLEHTVLPDGKTWTIPILKSVSEQEALSVEKGQEVLLVNSKDVLVGSVLVDSVFKHDHHRHAVMMTGSTDEDHQSVSRIFKLGQYFLSGKVKSFFQSDQNEHFSPKQVHEMIRQHEWNVVYCFVNQRERESFLSSNIRHADTPMIVQNVQGLNDEYQISILLPELFSQVTNHNEIVMQAVIFKNYGCTHFIIGREHEDILVEEGVSINELSSQVGIQIIGDYA